MRCFSCQLENPPGTVRCVSCGAELAAVGIDVESQVRSLLAQGEKIGAIKVYRVATGAGLKEAKDAVESLERSGQFPEASGETGNLDEELTALLQQGRKIEAIKAYRARTGAGLKEAKDAVEDLAARRGLVASGGSGCFGALIILAVLLGISAWSL